MAYDRVIIVLSKLNYRIFFIQILDESNCVNNYFCNIDYSRVSKKR